MANEKISAMPTAPYANPGDLATIVQSGVNCQISVQQFFARGPGENWLAATDDFAFISFGAGGDFQIKAAPATIMKIQGTIQVDYQPSSTGNWIVAPTTLAEAIDRIAAVVSNGGLNPIP